MADHILQTKIQLRYGTYAQWMNSQVILMPGEAAIATFPEARAVEHLSNTEPLNTPPAVGIKIGDGEHYFSELPWVQAVAADVYNWAKSMSKPTYTAQEIQGLESFIENHGGGGSSGATNTRYYALARGTGDYINRYYLQYKNSVDGNWILDTEHYIDLDDFATVVDWIGSDVETFPSLGNRTEQHIQYDLSLLSRTDSEQAGMFVTAVTQTNGQVAAEKKRLLFDDVTGVNPVSKGGTGNSSFETGEVLIGNGENALTTLAIDDELDNNRHLAYNFAVKRYIDQATAGLEGAMHFIGEAGVDPLTNRDPQISGYNIQNVSPGDVILWDYKEYVWTGLGWRLLGDEGSYAVKGSIVNADIADEANIAQSKIFNLVEDLADKVDKEEGKGLSSNDYTDEEKLKLRGIEDGAQRNKIDHILLNTVEVVPRTVDGEPNTVELNISEFDAQSRAKLETIAPYAQVNAIETIAINGRNQTIDEKRVDLVFNEFTDALKQKLEGIETGAQVNTIEHIAFNGQEITPNNKTVNIALTAQSLNLNVIEGAQIPGAESAEDVSVIDQQLQLARIAATGNVTDLLQTNNTYIILDCGSSVEVID